MVAFLNRKLRHQQTGPLELLRRANARDNAPVAGFPLPLRFADLEREILAGRHAFFRHREYHRDRHVGSGDSRQIHDLLLAEQFPSRLNVSSETWCLAESSVTKS